MIASTNSSGSDVMRTKVLVVDDDPLSVEFLRISLTEEGFQVSTARSCAEAVSGVSHNPPDVIITDISLPDGSGIDLIRAIKSQRKVSAISISGYQLCDMPKGSRQIFDRELTKPVDMTQLIRSVREIAGPVPS